MGAQHNKLFHYSPKPINAIASNPAMIKAIGIF
jgi:hypothetical protein